jgi:hypothetical protein
VMKSTARFGMIKSPVKSPGKNQLGECDARLGKPLLRARRKVVRECIALRDPTDCLLEAYDCVAKRAYEKFLAGGGKIGGQFEDWLKAERGLLPDIAVNIQESKDCMYALASVPGAGGLGVSVGIEARWLVIIADAGSHDYPLIDPANDHPPSQSVCVTELLVDVDPARSIAVLSDGLLAIRMPKIR